MVKKRAKAGEGMITGMADNKKSGAKALKAGRSSKGSNQTTMAARAAANKKKNAAQSAAMGAMAGVGGSMGKMASKIAKAGAVGKGLRKGLTKMRTAQAGIKNARKKVKAGKGRQR